MNKKMKLLVTIIFLGKVVCMEESPSNQRLIEDYRSAVKENKPIHDLLFKLTSEECNQEDAHSIINQLRQSGADLNALNNEGFTPLMSATLARSLPIVKALVEQGAQVNKEAMQGIGGTALFVAAYFGYSDIVTYLLEKKADTKIRDANNETAYDIAKNTDHLEIARLIEKAESQETN